MCGVGKGSNRDVWMLSKQLRDRVAQCTGEWSCAQGGWSVAGIFQVPLLVHGASGTLQETFPGDS